MSLWRSLKRELKRSPAGRAESIQDAKISRLSWTIVVNEPVQSFVED